MTNIINARGTYSPLGVSRSSTSVAKAVSNSLQQFILVEELQDKANDAITGFANCEAGTIVHCTSAAISIAVAACMSGSNIKYVEQLPDTTGMKSKVLIPSSHVVNYGHSILQAIRMSGAEVIIFDDTGSVNVGEFLSSIDNNDIACLLLVSSRLIRHQAFDYQEYIHQAQALKIPVVLDAAAQAFRVNDLVKLGPELVLISAQKYLDAPTSSIVCGKQLLVDAVRLQEKGIGRGMKATKEALVGVICALEEYQKINWDEWKQNQNCKVVDFVSALNKIPNIKSYAVEDPTGLPFSRVCMELELGLISQEMSELVEFFKERDDQIWCMDHEANENRIYFELIPLKKDEIETIIKSVEGWIRCSCSDLI